MHRWSARLALLAIAACVTPPAKPATVVKNERPVPAPHVDAVCPDSVLLDPYRSELFPGCPPAPFWRVGAVCDGACPKPCAAAIFDRAVGHQVGMAFEYDAKGVWTQTVMGWDLGRTTGQYINAAWRPDGRATYCTRDNARRGHCGRAESYPTPREIVDLVLTYDDDNNVIAIADPGDDRGEPTRFEYRPGHKLITEHHRGRRIDYTYDERGWITEISSSGHTRRTYTHDDAGKLASITTVYDQHRSVQRFEYDARGRLVKMVEDEVVTGLEPQHEENLYFYDCGAKRPFEDAITRATALSTKACACTDAVCKREVGREYDTFRYGLDGVTYGDTDKAGYDRLEAQRTTLEACVK